MIKGAGVALRQSHFSAIIEAQPAVSWFEVLADHYVFSRGILLKKLRSVLADTPRVMHCTGMSLGGVDAMDYLYLDELRYLIDCLQPSWVSDHLSASKINGVFYPELLPIPYTQESLDNVCRRVDTVQSYLQRPLLLENPVVYALFEGNEFSEAAFLAELVKRTGCGILLDINNLYVNDVNHGVEPSVYFECLPSSSVKQMHLAGHVAYQHFLLDTHSQPVQEPVWQLYRSAMRYFKDVPTCIEWDSDIPAWSVLCDEVNKISEVIYEACAV